MASVPPRRINAAYIRHAPLALTILCGFVGGGILSEIVQSMLPVSLNALGGPQSDAKRRTSLTIELRAISPFAGLSTKRSTSRTSWPIFWVAGSLSLRLAGSKRAQRDIQITSESPWTVASHDICNGIIRGSTTCHPAASFESRPGPWEPVRTSPPWRHPLLRRSLALRC